MDSQRAFTSLCAILERYWLVIMTVRSSLGIQTAFGYSWEAKMEFMTAILKIPRKRKILEDKIRDLQSKLHQMESINTSLAKELRFTKTRLEVQLTENSTLEKKLYTTRHHLEVLKSKKKFATVSTEELKPIETGKFEDRHSEPHTIHCSCLGEVENCHRCYGRGWYGIDKFGNQV